MPGIRLKNPNRGFAPFMRMNHNTIKIGIQYRNRIFRQKFTNSAYCTKSAKEGVRKRLQVLNFIRLLFVKNLGNRTPYLSKENYYKPESPSSASGIASITLRIIICINIKKSSTIKLL